MSVQYNAYCPPFNLGAPCEWVRRIYNKRENKISLQVSQNGYAYMTGLLTFKEAEEEINYLKSLGATVL